MNPPLCARRSAAPCGCPGRLPIRATRRQLLQTAAMGFGWLPVLDLLSNQSPAAPSAAMRPVFHHRPTAKSVIFCFMDGGVSHVDSFDPKPELTRRDGQPFTQSTNPTAAGARQWLACPWKFHRHGQSGLPISSLFPHTACCADDLAVIRSMKADLPLHSSGVLRLHTGVNNAGRPSLGSWVSYGLGNENANLPSFVVLSFGVVPCGGMETYSSGFLPATHQATSIRAEGVPLANLVPADADVRAQRLKLDLAAEQDGALAADLGGTGQIEAAIANYEMAFRMQSLVPDVLDLSRESARTLELYGINSSTPSQRLYGTQCLRARRLVEQGVRFVEIACPPGGSTGAWDQHGDLKKGHEKNALDTDQAVAALLTDLKARGLLEQTLVVWAGEFGRTPHSAGRDGRDHHPEGFSIWMAGGGVKGGTIHGATDELGMHAVENICPFHDLHATILHALGVDHERLTYRFGGRDFRLTDVHGRVIREVLL